MSMDSHLAELEQRHAALDSQIAEALTHPSADPIELTELKRRKLHLKDEIVRIKGTITVH